MARFNIEKVKSSLMKCDYVYGITSLERYIGLDIETNYINHIRDNVSFCLLLSDDKIILSDDSLISSELFLLGKDMLDRERAIIHRIAYNLSLEGVSIARDGEITIELKELDLSVIDKFPIFLREIFKVIF